MRLLTMLIVGIYVVVTPGCKTLEKTTVAVNVNLNITVPPIK